MTRPTPPSPRTPHAGGLAALVRLDPDHPGFRDPVYRARRDVIARLALAHETGAPVPDAPYSDEEHAVWGLIQRELAPLHDARVARPLLGLRDHLHLPAERIPQLREINAQLSALTGFAMEPVAGLVSARAFLTHLGQGVFLSTQYIRHASQPLYTPEPDVVHELVGHAFTLADPRIAALNRAFGRAAAEGTDAEVARLERVYWYTLEFGVVADGSALRAFGAGLLSSFGELGRFERSSELRDWDLDRMADTAYDPTGYQPELFVAPSYERLLGDLEAWLTAGRWRRASVAEAAPGS